MLIRFVMKGLVEVGSPLSHTRSFFMSAILSADDLNDFITPGVACIKPVEVEKTGDNQGAAIEIGTDGAPVEVDTEGREHKLKPAEISLTDCLACSGCITSSEAVLVEVQSPKELARALHEEKDKVFVASICHQSRASLAAAFRMSIAEVDARLSWFLGQKLGFEHIVGTEIGRAISLEATAQEATSSNGSKPILSSICPGWTCYAEKTHPEMIPYLSRVRSPQQITGRLLKDVILRARGRCAKDVYHLSIMPCFDKKLEASRSEYELDGAREVDLVITARELVEYMRTDFGISFYDAGTADLPPSPAGWPASSWLSNAGSSSGGYLAYVISRILNANPGATLEHQVQNTDLVEYVIMMNDYPLWRGAQVYGFRNIQNLVRKLKPSRTGRAKVVRQRPGRSDPTQWDYVELMACPGGCINGGGQMAPPENISARAWAAEVDNAYSTIVHTVVSSDVVSHYFKLMHIEASSQLLEATYQPVKPDPSIPAALTVGTQW